LIRVTAEARSATDADTLFADAQALVTETVTRRD